MNSVLRRQICSSARVEFTPSVRYRRWHGSEFNRSGRYRYGLVKPLLIFPNPAPPELVQALDMAGRAWMAVGTADEAAANKPDGGWAGAVVSADTDIERAWALCRALRTPIDSVTPLLLLITGRQLDDLDHRDELYDDFCITPFHPRELEKRIAHASWRVGGGDNHAGLIEHDGLAINIETYQAALDGRPLDLTHMEFQLLKFLASNPGRVFTREVLLSRVWGYDYFGGARTVDVHVRRLRSKLGEDRAAMIQTVRSVGYSFGESRWTT